MIPLTRPFFDANDLNIIEKVLKSGWVAGQGPMNLELSKEFSEFVNTKGAVPVNNCTAALHLSLLVYGIGQGDDVLVSDFTFPATGHAVLYSRANPIFLDSDIDTYNLSLFDMESKLTDKTKAIIPVHAFGNPVLMKEIMEFAREHELVVIEDAACAVGSKYDNKPVGSFGDLGCFSFHARKILASGEGGIVVGDDQEILKKVSSLSCFGMSSAKQREESDQMVVPSFTDLGYNYKLSDILAGLARSQLKKVPNSIKKRNSCVQIYKDLLDDVEGISFQKVDKRNVHAYQSCIIRLNSSKIRDFMFKELRKVGIQTQFGTYSSVCQPIYNSDPKLCPNSVNLFHQTLAIPLFDKITEEQIKTVSENIIRLLRKS